MPTQDWVVSVSHTQGQSVCHCCVSGHISDPIDQLPESVQADNEQHAIDKVYDILKILVDGWAHNCSRQFNPGSDRWYESIFVNVFPE